VQFHSLDRTCQSKSCLLHVSWELCAPQSEWSFGKRTGTWGSAETEPPPQLLISPAAWSFWLLVRNSSTSGLTWEGWDLMSMVAGVEYYLWVKRLPVMEGGQGTINWLSIFYMGIVSFSNPVRWCVPLWLLKGSESSEFKWLALRLFTEQSLK
jgi:hypothetical protein